MTFVRTHGDTLLALLPVPDGWKADDRLTTPWRPEPNTVYLFPRRFVPPQRTTTDEFVASKRERFPEDAPFRWEVMVCAASKGEQRTRAQDRSVSLILDDAVDAIVATVYANPRAEGLWWDLFVESIDYDVARQFEVRAHTVHVVERIIGTEPFPGS